MGIQPQLKLQTIETEKFKKLLEDEAKILSVFLKSNPYVDPVFTKATTGLVLSKVS
jgi:hypothetical protein